MEGNRIQKYKTANGGSAKTEGEVHRLVWIRKRKEQQKIGCILIAGSHLNFEGMVLTIEWGMAWLLWDVYW